MKTAISILAALCIVQSVLASPVESNSIDNGGKVPAGSQIKQSVALEAQNSITSDSQPTEPLPAQNLIAAIYRRAMAQALQTKVGELHQKLSTGENAIPTAVDILKLTLLSNPAQETIKKTAEHVLSMMSPEVKKLAPNAIFEDTEPTTPMPKKQTS